MNPVSATLTFVFGALAYCVLTAISFLLYLVPLCIGLWIIGTVFRAIF